jgi:hypothetical protein
MPLRKGRQPAILEIVALRKMIRVAEEKMCGLSRAWRCGSLR